VRDVACGSYMLYMQHTADSRRFMGLIIPYSLFSESFPFHDCTYIIFHHSIDPATNLRCFLTSFVTVMMSTLTYVKETAAVVTTML
jgi:hypothetical protein